MKEYVDRRLRELRMEAEAGQRQLGLLEARTADLKNTLLRISGAIQVLEELASEAATQGATNGAHDAFAAPVAREGLKA